MGIRSFDYDLRVINFMQVKKTVKAMEDPDGNPLKIMAFNGLSMADVRHFKAQLEHFITFMTGWPPKY